MARNVTPALGGLLLALALGACQDGQYGSSTRHLSPIPPQTTALMAEKGMSKADPILIRTYKKEAEMEVWKAGGDGKYALLKTFPICRWSGQLGPKVKEGDRQAPEGFYAITPAQMNPNSSYYLSFDTGYPNGFDRANERTGSFLMVHGTCSSRGCFAMTDESIAEIYALARESFGAGQRAFQFQSYPFRMTAENFAKFRNDPHVAFWKNLKEGADYFEALHEEPKVGVCGKRYVFGGADAAAGNCTPRVDPLVAERRQEDERKVAEFVAKGTPAMRVVYEDGGQHESFRNTMMAMAGGDSGSTLLSPGAPRRAIGDVSRPDALAMGPREIPVEAPVAGKGGRSVAVAAVKRTDPVPLAFAAAADPASAKVGTPAANAAPQRPVASSVAAAPEAIKPASVTVASADDEDPSVYRRVLGNLFGRAATPAQADVAQASDPAPEAQAGSVRRAAPKPRAEAPSTPGAARAGAAKPQAGRAAPIKPQAALTGAAEALAN